MVDGSDGIGIVAWKRKEAAAAKRKSASPIFGPLSSLGWPLCSSRRRRRRCSSETIDAPQYRDVLRAECRVIRRRRQWGFLHVKQQRNPAFGSQHNTVSLPRAAAWRQERREVLPPTDRDRLCRLSSFEKPTLLCGRPTSAQSPKALRNNGHKVGSVAARTYTRR